MYSDYIQLGLNNHAILVSTNLQDYFLVELYLAICFSVRDSHLANPVGLSRLAVCLPTILYPQSLMSYLGY